MRIVVLHTEVLPGARPDEAGIVNDAIEVAAALDKAGHDTRRASLRHRDLTALTEELRDARPDLVFNLVDETEGLHHLNVLAPLLLEMLGLPFTGCRHQAMAVTTDKVLAKRALRLAGVRTPDWISPDEGGGEARPGTYLLKPRYGDASIGLDEDHLEMYRDPESARRRATADRFAEAFVEGREFNVGIIDEGGAPRVLPIAEIDFHDYPEGKPKIVGYRAKWDESSFEYGHTARNFDFPAGDEPLLGRLGETALLCWRLFGLGGYGRVDFRVDGEGIPWVLEVNGNPGLGSDAGLAAAAERAGIGYGELIETIAREALRRS
ncbi:MAG: D-alanine--D-alanine ligase [Candidatus Eisenbacteria bacterium]|nr:D-alanine--D-alanine ligase [Candidatus Eisenbacteria bacterium]